MKTQKKNNKLKLIVLNRLDYKRSQISRNIDFIVKAWKLENITTLNELYSVRKTFSLFVIVYSHINIWHIKIIK